MKRIALGYGATALAFTLATAGVARAQDAAPAAAPAAGGEAQGSAQVGGGAHASGGMTLPGAAPGRAAATGDSDHDGVIGTFAIGFLGVVELPGLPVTNAGGVGLPVGCAAAAEPNCTNLGGAIGVGTVGAPVIGARYWLNEMIGIDAGLGLGIYTLGGSAPGGNIDRPSYNAFVLHGGVPLALASSGHFTFEVIPEMNIGFSNWSQDVQNAPSESGSGFHFDIGARAGAEIQFGFIGIPQLALQGTIGLSFLTESTKFDPGAGGSTKLSQTGVATTVQGNPWDIFRSNIAALYYF